jgi:YfiH family protein
VPTLELEQTPLGRIAVPAGVPPGYALFYTTTDIEGHLKGDTPTTLRRFIRERFGIDAELATCTQVHGVAVVKSKVAEGDCDTCDALWSDQPGHALGIKVADCLPVTLIDAPHGVMANIHSGWRGTVQRITDITLDVLSRETDFDPATTRAWLGPAIRVCCFEVGEEVVDQFRATYPNADAFIDRTRGPKPHIDVAGLTREVLVARGVGGVVDVGICTRCDHGVPELQGYRVAKQPSNSATRQPLFHSYRRDSSRGGRNLAIVVR